MKTSKLIKSLGLTLALAGCNETPSTKGILEGNYNGEHFQWVSGVLTDTINVREIGQSNWLYSVEFSTGTTQPINWREITKDGRVINVQEKIFPVPDMLIANPYSSNKMSLTYFSSKIVVQSYATEALHGIREVASQKTREVEEIEAKLLSDLNKDSSMEKN